MDKTPESGDLATRKQKLREDLLRLGELAETAVDSAVVSLVEASPDLAREVIEGDRALNLLELLIDKECLDLLQFFRPAGEDLRFVTAALKINNDLERIGDLAADIAHQVPAVGKGLPARLRELPALVERVEQMVRNSVQTLVKLDIKLARRLKDEDHKVDADHDRLIRQLVHLMQEDKELVPDAVGLLNAIRCLERIGDLVTDIAEEVIYAVEGEVTRHDQDLLPAAGNNHAADRAKKQDANKGM